MNRPLDQLMKAGALPYSISADEFWRMVEAGVFDGQRIELVDGELIEMAPSNRPHGELAAEICAKLYPAFPKSKWVFCLDTYVTTASDSVRAPDIVVFHRQNTHLTRGEAAAVLLAIEVSHTTLRQDLIAKRIHYAGANIPYYWVVDVDGEKVHRFSNPVDGDYRDVVVSGFENDLPLPEVGDAISLR
jgi:Uma2 family endonuclease